jgi:hypothetical protein
MAHVLQTVSLIGCVIGLIKIYVHTLVHTHTIPEQDTHVVQTNIQ